VQEPGQAAVALELVQHELLLHGAVEGQRWQHGFITSSIRRRNTSSPTSASLTRFTTSAAPPGTTTLYELPNRPRPSSSAGDLSRSSNRSSLAAAAAADVVIEAVPDRLSTTSDVDGADGVPAAAAAELCSADVGSE
jgi:hypothetical protein